MEKIRVLCYGLGPIGARTASLAWHKERLEVVGAVDIDPEKQERDLGSLFPEPMETGVSVSGNAADCLAETKPQVVLHCTSSFLPSVVEQIHQVLASGSCLVSSTEELLWPRLQHPDLAEEIDAAAKARNLSVLGTGVNPGFVLDSLAAFATSVCYEVDRVICLRCVDAGTRRIPFQLKVGAGLTGEEFRARAKQGGMGHIGLPETIALLGAACGFELDDIGQSIDPILAERDLDMGHLKVPRGRVAGIHNRGYGVEKGKPRIEMDLKMFIGAEDPKDEIRIFGKPDLRLVLPGGVPGDDATAAMLVHATPLVLEGPSGLLTMLDLPLFHHFR